MCGRFVLAAADDDLREIFELEVISAEGRVARYNIAPTQEVVIIPNRTTRKLVQARWGLIPSWAKDKTIGSRLINARGETVAEKPSFRSAFKKRRCLIPSDGFYEWKRDGKRKRPFFFHLADESTFAFAGLFEFWKSPEGTVVASCTIVTTEPNELVAQVHKRMPVILPREHYAAWLDPEPCEASDLLPLLAPYAADAMEAHEVSATVNSPAHDGPDCMEPVAARAPGRGLLDAKLSGYDL